MPDVDHPGQRPAREVHFPHVGMVQGRLGPFGAEAQHELVLDDSAGHVPVHHEREAAEHLPLGQALFVRQQHPHPVGELLVVGHRYRSSVSGRPKRPKSAGSAKPTMPATASPASANTMIP